MNREGFLAGQRDFQGCGKDRDIVHRHRIDAAKQAECENRWKVAACWWGMADGLVAEPIR